MPPRSSQPNRPVMSWPTPEDFQNDSLWDDDVDDENSAWTPSEDREFIPMSPFPDNYEVYNFEEVEMNHKEKDPNEVQEVPSLQRMPSPSPPPTPCFTRSPSPTASEFDVELMDDVFYDDVGITDENHDFLIRMSTPQFEMYEIDLEYYYYWDDRSRA